MIATLRLICVAAAMSGLALAAYAPTEPQRNAIEHFSQVEAGSRKCDDWELNTRLVGNISLALGIDYRDSETLAYLEERLVFHQERMKDTPREVTCEGLELLYGPEGENVRNLALRARPREEPSQAETP